MHLKEMANSNVCIVVLVGLPASGKSSLALKLTNVLRDRGSLVDCIVYDDIVPLAKQAEIASCLSRETTKENRLLMRNRVQSLLSESSELANRVVIVDDNNYYRSMRYEYYQLAAKYLTGYVELFLPCSVEEAAGWNAKRGERHSVPETVIVKMEAKFEAPSESWENSLTIHRTDLQKENLLDDILQRIKCSSPVVTRLQTEEKIIQSVEGKLANDRSVCHNIDKVLRKEVGLLIAENKCMKNMSVFAEKLNLIRNQILKDVKLGIVVIPKEVTEKEEIDISLLNQWASSIFHENCANLV